MTLSLSLSLFRTQYVTIYHYIVGLSKYKMKVVVKVAGGLLILMLKTLEVDEGHHLLIMAMLLHQDQKRKKERNN